METVSCQLCSLLLPHLRSYVSHLRQVHSKDQDFPLTCIVQDCQQRFRTFAALNSHLYRIHRSALGLNSSSNDVEREQIENGPLYSESSVERSPPLCILGSDDGRQLPDDIQHDVMHMLGTDVSHQQLEAVKFLLKLKEVCNVSKRTVGEVIEGCKTLFGNSFSMLKASVKDYLGEADISSMDGLDSLFCNIPNPFHGLETTYMQEKYFRDHFQFLVSYRV